MATKKARDPQLPKQQLLILAICRFAEPVAMSSVYPYIPEMIQSFDVPTDQVAKWAGLLAATFSLSQCLTGIAWGRASDRFGRKPIIITALTCTMFAGLLFGFSKNLAWAFAARSLQGLSNGNVGIIRTAVAELVPQRELQPRAFSIMPLVWNIGCVFGPAFGGALVHPVERFPGVFKNSRLFQQFPFAMPNMVASILFLIGIASGILFLKETLEEKKSNRDYGLILGSLITRPCTKSGTKNHLRKDSLEDAPFLSNGNNNEMSTSPRRDASVDMSPQITPIVPSRKNPAWADVFTRQSNINLVVYTFLAMHAVSFDQLLPIFMHHPIQSHDDKNFRPPLKFAGGFGLGSDRIGALFVVYGFFGMLIQFTLFPPVARRFGVLLCLKWCAVVMPLVYIATPFVALLDTDAAREGVVMVLMMVKCVCAIFAFPCSTILLTNSAASLKVLGTLNGVATSISAVGRAAGPALAGGTFTLGVKAGYVVVPWWTLAGVATFGAIPVWWLVEMEGFNAPSADRNNNDDTTSSEEEERLVRNSDEDVFEDGPDCYLDTPADPSSASQSGLGIQGQVSGAETCPGETAASSTTAQHRKSSTASPMPTASSRKHTNPAISDGVQPDSPTSSRSSSFVATLPTQRPSLGKIRSRSNGRANSSSETNVRRTSFADLQRTNSPPIGMGPHGVASGRQRRYSSDLGATRSGLGTGGTTAWH